MLWKFCNFVKNFTMEAITIEIVHPKAKRLIEDLAAMKLININQSTTSINNDLKKILDKLRSNDESTPTLDEITKEVESARANRHANKV